MLAGCKALVVGIANDQSIAYGCAKAFRTAGAELAVVVGIGLLPHCGAIGIRHGET